MERHLNAGFAPLTAGETADLRILEERLSMPAANESREALGGLLADGFEEFGSSGRRFDRDAVLEVLVPGGRPPIVMEGFSAVRIGQNAALLRYVSRPAAGAGGKPPARRSSLWIFAEGRWQLLFHQGTLLPPGR